jgi:hypothetical protein
MDTGQIAELRALIEAGELDRDRGSMVRSLWRAVMTNAEASSCRGETRWRDYHKFQADVHTLMIHGVL